jgi:uncharacterized membrane protein
MTTVPITPAESSPRSTFVTVVAWIALAWSALATLGALGSLLFLAVTPTATVNAVVNRVTQDSSFQLLPAPYQLLAHHVYLVALVKVVWWATVLVVSIGVLRRKEWARRAFVAVLGIEIVLVIFGTVLGQSIGMKLATQLAARSRSGQVPPGMGSGLALGGLFGIAIVAILVWLLLRFRSDRVRTEFESMRRAA